MNASNITKNSYNLLLVDAWCYDGEWVWNESMDLGGFEATDDDVEQAILRELSELGIFWLEGKYEFGHDTNDGSVEVIEKGTGRPLFCATPCIPLF